MVLITRLTKSHDPLSKMLNGQVGNSVVLLVQVLDVITFVREMTVTRDHKGNYSNYSNESYCPKGCLMWTFGPSGSQSLVGVLPTVGH